MQTEGFKVLADKLSSISPEVTKFNTFINQKQPKRFLASLKIDMEFYLKKFLGKILGPEKQENFANAYTVLTQKSQDLQIF